IKPVLAWTVEAPPLVEIGFHEVRLDLERWEACKASAHKSKLKMEIVVERIAYPIGWIDMEIVNLKPATAIISGCVEVILLRLSAGKAKLKRNHLALSEPGLVVPGLDYKGNSGRILC